MSSIKISHPTGILTGEFVIPGSKSESNRAIVMNALSGNKIRIENNSPAEDTQHLLKLFSRHSRNTDVKNAGTTMRFLTAYYCAINKNKIITGSQRMQERPVGKLVDALRAIGFKIHYVNKEGFPPVEIIPSERLSLKYEVEVDASESSQFVSALLMIAPCFPDGLILKLNNRIVSKPYIDMTLQMMSAFGIAYEWKKDKITILPQTYKETVFKVGSDWTSASYWYSMVALSKEATITLFGLSKDSFQGDKIIAHWMEGFGVTTTFLANSIILKNDKVVHPPEWLDFINHPDLAQTLIVLAAAKSINLKVSGLRTLALKETDRIIALQNELKKIGAQLEKIADDTYQLMSEYKPAEEKIETYNDHRMAMSFAPISLKNQIAIVNPSVINKSYPNFWEQLKAAGFNC